VAADPARRRAGDADTRKHSQVILLLERPSRPSRTCRAVKLESGSTKLDPGPLDVAALATRLCEELAPRIRERGFDVRVHGADGPRAFADRRAVEQILSNLLDNALKYSDPGKRIDVRVSAEDGAVRVDVAERGDGIPDAGRGAIFERFYRVDAALARAGRHRAGLAIETLGPGERRRGVESTRRGLTQSPSLSPTRRAEFFTLPSHTRHIPHCPSPASPPRHPL
jgi:light-regulated signal transduction histidine kinase (bacteriophytochrome)